LTVTTKLADQLEGRQHTGGTLQLLDASSVDVDRVAGDGGGTGSFGELDWQPHHQQRSVLRSRLDLYLSWRVRQLCIHSYSHHL